MFHAQRPLPECKYGRFGRGSHILWIGDPICVWIPIELENREWFHKAVGFDGYIARLHTLDVDFVSGLGDPVIDREDVSDLFVGYQGSANASVDVGLLVDLICFNCVGLSEGSRVGLLFFPGPFPNSALFEEAPDFVEKVRCEIYAESAPYSH